MESQRLDKTNEVDFRKGLKMISEDLPKKLKISGANESGGFTEWGTLEWDGDKWFVSGKNPLAIKLLVGKRGMTFGGKLFTLKDRGLFAPLLKGYSQLLVEEIE